MLRLARLLVLPLLTAWTGARLAGRPTRAQDESSGNLRREATSANVIIDPTPRTPESEGPTPERWVGYDVVVASPSYSNVTGLVAGFALGAVVLVFTVAATKPLNSEQKVDIGFAAALFALSFVGCLLCAYSFASLSGEKKSAATLTYSMIVGSAVAICLIAVLGGFEALAQAFLKDASPVFVAVCVGAAIVAPPFVWAPQWDIVQNCGKPPEPGPPQDTRAANRLLVALSVLGLLTALAALLVRLEHAFGMPHRWEYLAVTLGGLVYTIAAVLGALAISTANARRARLTIKQNVAMALVHAVIVFSLVALMP